MDFPTSDEEFELMHEDEYEVLRDIEGQKPKTQDKQPLNTQSKEVAINHINETTQSDKYDNIRKEIKDKQPLGTQTNEVAINHVNESTKSDKYDKIRTELNGFGLDTPSTSKNQGFNNTSANDNSKKRSYEELFGNIDDIEDFYHFDAAQEPTDKRPRWDQPKELIELILDSREKFLDTNIGVPSKKKNCEDNRKRDTISTRVPRWNFVALTRSYDSQRIYIRLKNDIEGIDASDRSISNLLLQPYTQLKTEAEEIIAKNVEQASRRSSSPDVTEVMEEYELWVDKYRPRSYVELLSDESVNRHFLHWLKLWDKVVFNRNVVQRKKKQVFSLFVNKNFNKDSVEEELDSKGFPIHRIALLSGPPGLGKTTLAHLAAKHAGYNVVEINASDERSPDVFRQVLLASTQMKAVMGSNPRPNCLILDEIDGAPSASIELLLKFVQGKLTAKGRKDKAKGSKASPTCHRPVICICNEPYTPSLRLLRAAALIIPVPEVTPIRLADRLMEIAKQENLKVNPSMVLKLAETSGCDVRSCLGALQYLGSSNFNDKFSFALKDSRKNLFQSWKQILTIPMTRSGLTAIPDRVKMVLKTVQSGEVEKLIQGVFHNYPEICGEKLMELSTSLEWFQFYDEVMSLILSHQNWSIMPYTNYTFISLHLLFATTRNPKLSYPTIVYEVNQKTAKSVGTLIAIQRSSGRGTMILATDIAPFLPDLLSPQLRAVSGHLYTTKERADMARLVNILLEYGLSFVQERNLDGVYQYKIDPDIFEIGTFPDCKHRRPLAYAVKQIITQQLETERLRRAANITGITSATENKESNQNITKTSNKSPDQKEKEKAKQISKRANIRTNEIYKDFFGRPITVNQKKEQGSGGSTVVPNLLTKHGVWFKYKEGFTNAVRRTVLMEDIL